MFAVYHVCTINVLLPADNYGYILLFVKISEKSVKKVCSPKYTSRNFPGNKSTKSQF